MNVALPTPRARVLHERACIYDFGNGATGQIELLVSGRFDWVLDLPQASARFPLGTVCGTSGRGDHAFLNMWCRAASLSTPDPIELNSEELAALAHEAETALVVDVAKVYRRVLKLRTGFAWSVRVGKKRRPRPHPHPTTRSTIRIMSATRRQRGSKMTTHDAALLASIAGANLVNPSNGVTVSSDKGSRRAMTYLLAGVPQPCAPVLRIAR